MPQRWWWQIRFDRYNPSDRATGMNPKGQAIAWMEGPNCASTLPRGIILKFLGPDRRFHSVILMNIAFGLIEFPLRGTGQYGESRGKRRNGAGVSGTELPIENEAGLPPLSA